MAKYVPYLDLLDQCGERKKVSLVGSPRGQRTSEEVLERIVVAYGQLRPFGQECSRGFVIYGYRPRLRIVFGDEEAIRLASCLNNRSLIVMPTLEENLLEPTREGLRYNVQKRVFLNPFQ